MELAPGSRYIRSLCEPFNEEMELDEKRVTNWLDLFRLGEPVQIHASGHASGEEILEAIETIKPKKLIPIHTQRAANFKEKYDATTLVELGQTIKL